MASAADDPLHEDLERIDEVGGKSLADEFLDELMPPDFEWRQVVRRHPIPSLLVAAGVGYWLARGRRGAALAEAALGAVAIGLTSRLGGGDSSDGIHAGDLSI